MLELNPRIKLFLFFLLIIGVVAALTLPAKVMHFTVKLYMETASPYSIDYMGTSMFYNYLVKKNYSVVIADSWDKLIDEASKDDSIIVIIAPDKPITMEEAIELYALLLTRNISIIIADENITSNSFLGLFGLRIDGRLVFQLVFTEKYFNITPYPSTVVYFGEECCITNAEGKCSLCAICATDHGKGVYMKLNYASIIYVNRTCVEPFNKITIYGVIDNSFIDVNDNDRPDEFTSILGAAVFKHVFMVELSSDDGRKMMVIADSFPFTNQALTMPHVNKTYYEFIDLLLSEVGGGRKRVVIDNSHYNYRPENIGIPFHPAMLLLLIGMWLNSIDKFITEFIIGNKMLTFITSLGIIMTTVIVIKSMFGIKEEAYLELKGVDEIRVLAETPLRKSFIEKKGKIPNPREVAINLWKILNLATKRFYGEDLENIIANREELGSFARTLGISEKELGGKLRWMYKVYLKASGKRKLPVILSWKRTLGRFIGYSEQILEKMGYTLMRKAGYRGIETILH